MIKSTILSNVLTACVCVPTTAIVAPKVHHAIQRHYAPAHHRTVAAPPRVAAVSAPCTPVPISQVSELQVGPVSIEAEPIALASQDAPQPLARLLTPVTPGPLLIVPPAPPVAPIPEPATWGMFIVGFGAIGTVLRSGKREARA